MCCEGCVAIGVAYYRSLEFVPRSSVDLYISAQCRAGSRGWLFPCSQYKVAVQQLCRTSKLQVTF
jgi:hypothetical protein